MGNSEKEQAAALPLLTLLILRDMGRVDCIGLLKNNLILPSEMYFQSDISIKTLWYHSIKLDAVQSAWKLKNMPTTSHRFLTHWGLLRWELTMKRQKLDSVSWPANSDGLCSCFAPMGPRLADGNGLVSIWGDPGHHPTYRDPLRGHYLGYGGKSH